MPTSESSGAPLKPDRPTGAQRKRLMRLRRRALRLPFGAKSPDDPGEPRGGGGRGGGGSMEGGAGVREPRRPRSDPPAMAAEAPEPVDQFLQLDSSRV